MVHIWQKVRQICRCVYVYHGYYVGGCDLVHLFIRLHVWLCVCVVLVCAGCRRRHVGCA